MSTHLPSSRSGFQAQRPEGGWRRGTQEEPCVTSETRVTIYQLATESSSFKCWSVC